MNLDEFLQLKYYLVDELWWACRMSERLSVNHSMRQYESSLILARGGWAPVPTHCVWWISWYSRYINSLSFDTHAKLKNAAEDGEPSCRQRTRTKSFTTVKRCCTRISTSLVLSDRFDESGFKCCASTALACIKSVAIIFVQPLLRRIQPRILFTCC